MGGGHKMGVSSYGTYVGNCNDCNETKCNHYGKQRHGCSEWFPNDAYVRREDEQWHPWEY